MNRDDVQEVGKQFCHSKDYQKISFTGSTAVGKWLYREGASTVKRVRSSSESTRGGRRTRGGGGGGCPHALMLDMKDMFR